LVEIESAAGHQPFPLPIDPDIFKSLVSKRVTVRISAPEAIADNQLRIMGTICEEERSDQEPPVVTSEVFSIPFEECKRVPLFRDLWLQAAGGRLPRIAVVLNDKDTPLAVRKWIRNFKSAAESIGVSIYVSSATQLEVESNDLASADILVVLPQAYSEPLRRLVTNVKAAYGVVVACRCENSSPIVSELRKVSSVLMRIGGESHLSLAGSHNTGELALSSECGEADVRAWIRDVTQVHRSQCLPKVSIVTVLYRKEREIPFFLRALKAQDYRGEVELVVVDDKSPDASVELLEAT
jgi:hypothetical protein